MKNLLIKEMTLSASVLSYCFIAFTLMTFIPGYPILVSAFFICFGIFHSFQSGRENNDILYTVLLPVKKTDAVLAKYLFVCFIQLVSLVLIVLFTLFRMLRWGQAGPYVNNAMMNANPLFWGWVLLVFTLFNFIFVRGFFRTGYRFSGPFLTFILLSFLLIALAEALHFFPGLAYLNAPGFAAMGDHPLLFWGFPLLCLGVYALFTVLSCRSAQKLFSRVDL